ncbi:MAG: helix-turn-helix domain-containing protein [Chloroflexi bacterium]|nr:helix-turn-helix domain-containing protein [Chloroflexota bacterium]
MKNVGSSPVGATAAEAAARRAARSPEYRAERDRLREFEDIARLVIRFRAKHNLTQQELARLVGTSHSAISRIESGQHKTSVETLRRIAKALGVRLVVGFESGPPEQPERELVAL